MRCPAPRPQNGSTARCQSRSPHPTSGSKRISHCNGLPQWVRAARHIGIAPGTFGWWAGYLSKAQTIYYPALPSGAMPWCLIMPTDDPRYLFVRAKQGPHTDDAAPERTARGGTADALAARRECLVAQKDSSTFNKLKANVPVMNRNIRANA